MIAVLGLGFVGLTVALGFAEKGIEVYGVDTDEFRADLIRNGKIPYFEPGLDEALERHINGNFHVVPDLDDVPDHIDCFFICVGSPKAVDDVPDFSNIFHAVGEVLDSGFEGYYTIVVKTTLLPGTMDSIIAPHIESRGVKIGEDIGLAYNPNFMREGTCWHDFTYPSRIVLGITSERDREILARCYEGFEAPLVTVSYATAEFTRYLTSTLLATMVSFSNEMAQAAKAIGGIDVAEAFRIVQMDNRWNDNTMRAYVHPGCGYGGISLPKETNDFIKHAHAMGAQVPLLEDVQAINERRASEICDQIEAVSDRDERVGILGLAFKEGSGDVRYSASARIIDELLARDYEHIYAYDPVANDYFAAEYHQPISYLYSVREVCDTCDVIVVATPWRQFRIVPSIASDKKVIDCRLAF